MGGGTRPEEDSCALWDILLRSGEDLDTSASFPKIRIEASSFEFVSPADQCSWKLAVTLKEDPDPFH
jgi:hypothetical protein